ncbi:ROK family transcriptional regulator [Microlunatus panaciterrae]|uniref:NBD/HSP70 family sugar kinase n=1 Tax=Microlunatus panaciterrae TaxID=400768 RepID=A0ABS2RJV7_9ACTN|nr:ROK family transcriptional regulator [Microlunatus panaciterrae]MBM7799286.1 putative NBD/HSP70 family sugar kinase [Microlunatus panaciterrae]
MKPPFVNLAESAEEPPGATVRRLNSIACLQAVRDAASPLSVSGIAERTGLSRPTVEAVLADLAAGGLIKESHAFPRGTGRPARRFVFDATAGRVAGVDVGPHSIRVLVADLSGHVIGRSTTRISGREDADSRLTTVRDAVESALGKSGAGLGDLRAVGLGVPGILGVDDRIVSSLAIPEWVGEDLTGRLGSLLHCPVVIENDIKLAALAELHAGAAQGVRNLAFFQIGHRVSLALIMNGQIVQGSHRLAGELGSLRGMKWTSTSVRGELRWSSAPTARDVFRAAAEGDVSARAEVQSFCAEIAPRFGTILLTVDPDLVVIGGGLSGAGRQLLDPLQAAVDRVLMTPEKPPITASALASAGAVTGALGSAFHHCSAEILRLPGVPAPWSVWSPEFGELQPTPDITHHHYPNEVHSRKKAQ